MQTSPTTYPDYDTRWKELVKSLHRYVIKRFFPRLYRRIDWSKGVKFLDKELAKIMADWTKKGKKTGDLLLEYHLKNGKKQLILIHIELQHSPDPYFSERMFTSYYRIKDAHPGKQLTALAIYTGPRVPKNPGIYKSSFEGTEITYKFNYIILKDLKVSELLASDNPFDLALLAGVQILRVKSNPQRAFRYKLNLVRLCFNKGYDIQTTRALIIFVSFIIALPQTEQKKFEQEIIKTIVMEEKPLIEVDRSTTLLLTRIFFGKPYEELMAEWKAKADRLGRASGRRKAKKEMEKAKKEMEKAKKEMEKSMSERVEELAKARAEELAKARAEELAKARAEELAKARAEELAKKKIERLKKKTKEEQKRTSILQAYFQAGLPVNTISKIFDTDTATIKKIISQAKKKKTEKNGKPPKGSSS